MVQSSCHYGQKCVSNKDRGHKLQHDRLPKRQRLHAGQLLGIVEVGDHQIQGADSKAIGEAVVGVKQQNTFTRHEIWNQVNSVLQVVEVVNGLGFRTEISQLLFRVDTVETDYHTLLRFLEFLAMHFLEEVETPVLDEFGGTFMGSEQLRHHLLPHCIVVEGFHAAGRQDDVAVVLLLIDEHLVRTSQGLAFPRVKHVEGKDLKEEDVDHEAQHHAQEPHPGHRLDLEAGDCEAAGEGVGRQDVDRVAAEGQQGDSEHLEDVVIGRV
mmetsp:Transcript_5727/g.9098  ORF Transcript_5727/g.9098 Transcript_5727/m.9098 type:complete len:267 (+) Transcript_5727:800-1600(+)